MYVEDFAYIIVGFLLGMLINKLLSKYLEKKGENLATKEDISEITDKIELVRYSYTEQLESIKAELSTQITLHSFRYEKEYEVLKELTSLLVDLRDVSVSFRDMIGSAESTKYPGKSQGGSDKEKLDRFCEVAKRLYSVREKKRPFYSDDVYQKILEVEKASGTELDDHQNKDTSRFHKRAKWYWEEIHDNHSRIIRSVEKAIIAVRERVTEWETLKKR